MDAMKTNGVLATAMALLLVTACSASDTSKEQARATESTPEQIQAMQKDADKTIAREMARVQQKDASTWPCSLFPQAEAEALVGNPLDKGSYTFNNVTDNDHQYKSESCAWSASGGGGNEASLWVSLPKHFDSGQVECSPGSGNKQVSGIGNSTWWDYQKYWGAGTLRVCAAKAMLEVKVTLKSKDEAATRKIAEEMAEKVLASQ
jgi:hypothetical protein